MRIFATVYLLVFSIIAAVMFAPFMAGFISSASNDHDLAGVMTGMAAIIIIEPLLIATAVVSGRQLVRQFNNPSK